jgi:hypothetical protein
MKHQTLAATILLAWSLSLWTGSFAIFQHGQYKTQRACKAAGLGIEAQRKAAAEKEKAKAIAEERVNPKIGHGSDWDNGEINWNCLDDKAKAGS